MAQLIHLDVFLKTRKESELAAEFLLSEGFFVNIEYQGEKPIVTTAIDVVDFKRKDIKIKEMIQEVINKLERRFGEFVWHCFVYDCHFSFGFGSEDDPDKRLHRDDNPCGVRLRKSNYHHGFFGGDADDDD